MKAFKAKISGSANVHDTVNKASASLEKLRPAIRECGYKLGGVDVVIGIPPAISVTLVAIDHENHLEAIAALKERDDLDKFGKAVVMALEQAEKLKAKLDSKSKLTPGSVTATLSIPPSVTVGLVPIDDE